MATSTSLATSPLTTSSVATILGKWPNHPPTTAPVVTAPTSRESFWKATLSSPHTSHDFLDVAMSLCSHNPYNWKGF